jgi:hypothetical protein
MHYGPSRFMRCGIEHECVFAKAWIRNECARIAFLNGVCIIYSHNIALAQQIVRQ